MTHLTHLPAPEGLTPGNGYSHVVLGTGRFVAISGQCAFDDAGRIVGEGDADAQARPVFENLHRCLTAAGATSDHVAKLTFFVTDVAYLPAARAARDAVSDPARPPAKLITPELLLEVDAFALIDEPGRQE